MKTNSNDNLKPKLSRRGFLAGLSLLPWLPADIQAANKPSLKEGFFINGHHNNAGKFYISGINSNGSEKFRLALPEMPHGFAPHPNNDLLVILPGLTGTKLNVINSKTAKKVAETRIRKDRHFNGHAVFSPDGKWLFTTENIIDSSEGVIGVYETKNFSFVRELPAYGLGPHGIDILSDGTTLVIASGGLRTRLDSGKYYFDLNSMRSSVNYIDANSGKLLNRIDMPVHRLSIRQAIVFDNDKTLVVCQYKGRREMPYLVGIQQGGGAIEMLPIDEDSLWLMNGYVGHVTIAGNIAAVSSPRGKGMGFWDLKQKTFMGSVKINDVSGVQPIKGYNDFIASANTGELYHINAKKLTATLLNNMGDDVKWTNHMIKIAT